MSLSKRVTAALGEDSVWMEVHEREFDLEDRYSTWVLTQETLSKSGLDSKSEYQRVEEYKLVLIRGPDEPIVPLAAFTVIKSDTGSIVLGKSTVVSRDGHRGDDGGGTPIVNFEVTPPPIIKILNGLLWGRTPIKISNWGDEIIKIVEKFAQIL